MSGLLLITYLKWADLDGSIGLAVWVSFANPKRNSTNIKRKQIIHINQLQLSKHCTKHLLRARLQLNGGQKIPPGCLYPILLLRP